MLSLAQASIASAADCAVDFASASWARSFWLMNSGSAIAARMPRISITTSSSIRVKPDSAVALSDPFHQFDYRNEFGSIEPLGAMGMNSE